MYALISDLHSNIEALTAVLDDMETYDVEKVYCLGDAIGYGPDPRPVLDLVKKCEICLLGNHEEGLMLYAEDFNPRARRALEWTRDQINGAEFAQEENYEFWGMIDQMPKLHRDQGALMVHASLRDETRDYVLPSDIADREKMDEIFEKMDLPVCFFGHTHVPGVWTESRRFRNPEQLDFEYALPKEKVAINVGSVGQPRDGDNRAAYVLVDGDRVIFRRVAYDFRKTMKKILAIDALDDMLGMRLKVGK